MEIITKFSRIPVSEVDKTSEAISKFFAIFDNEENNELHWTSMKKNHKKITIKLNIKFTILFHNRTYIKSHSTRLRPTNELMNNDLWILDEK